MNSKISIIVPIYNVEQYLSKCLDSLVNQTMNDIEIICVNDGSTDNSLQILEDYASRDGRLSVINQANTGVSAARNKALDQVKGEYFMFVDSDDWLDYNTCEELYAKAIATDADSLMFSYTKEFGSHSIVNHIFEEGYFVWNTEEIKQKFYRRLFGLIGNELARPQDGDLIVSACMQLFKTEKFKEVRFFDNRQISTFEDGLYQIDLYRKCQKFVYIGKPLYHYRKTNSESITSKYNPNLCMHWQRLYDIMEEKIVQYGLDSDYRKALQNRICLGVLGAGINLVHSNMGIRNGSKEMKAMVSMPRYQMALSQLDTSVMPIAWRAFFGLVKHKCTILLFMMLKMIEYFRTNRRQ